MITVTKRKQETIFYNDIANYLIIYSLIVILPACWNEPKLGIKFYK